MNTIVKLLAILTTVSIFTTAFLTGCDGIAGGFKVNAIHGTGNSVTVTDQSQNHKGSK